MKITNKLLNFIIVFFIFFSLSIFKVNATSANVYFGGNNAVYSGGEITVTLAVSGVSGGKICGISGNVSFDSSYLQYISGTGMTSPFGVQLVPNNNYKFAGVDMSLAGFSSNATVLTLKFKALKLGNTNVSLSNASFNDCSNIKSNVSASKLIAINNPPSSNSNLASLSVSGQNLNFNPNTTNYNINVDSNAANISINAGAADGGARVSGTGSKSLNFGNNTFKVIVTAPSGSTKTYTINVNRKDNRSDNNYLSTLTIEGGSLEPNFSKDVLNYNLKVPYDIIDLKVNAVAADNKSKVVITGNNGLVSEETKDVVITITAENGSVKTYIIKVTRGKDPNKPLSNNNYLSSISVNLGLLSPIFNKDKLDYVVYLPFEIDKIAITGVLEDTKYGVLKLEGPEVLNVGNNKYTLEVKAEDGTSRIYTVNVIRAISFDNVGSALLKDIKITGGKLIGQFDSNVFEYKYSKNKDFKIEAIALDETSKIKIIEKENVILIVVDSANGETAIYFLNLKQSNMIPLMIVESCVLITWVSYIVYVKCFKNKIKKTKKGLMSNNVGETKK